MSNYTPPNFHGDDYEDDDAPARTPVEQMVAAAAWERIRREEIAKAKADMAAKELPQVEMPLAA